MKSDNNDAIDAPMRVQMDSSQKIIMNSQNDKHLPQLMIGISIGSYTESGV